ncbi:hypothetical protein F5Y00DRAFT_258979 [Daldinia vernicosa]|uniref:uncharacterized protein n=1 Tax=Daldinia vernicosa TaxID=114800 RepID=UPI0020086E2B|nr:uncharacterized protein F5Y00DRAFT_258979 [Daldinia vernicosa]KAI0852022.1 hypothetical protein F5Y00DRAFT_258979 [Daldinia vernicosa]
MYRVYCPPTSAKELRWRCNETEPREPTNSHIFRDATTMQGRQTAQSSVGTEHKTQRLTFDSLPFDIKDSIFEMVGSLPSWAYFKFRKGKLIECWGGNQEVHANREWHESHQLRQGLSVINPSNGKSAGVGALAEGILRLFSEDDRGAGSPQGRPRGRSHSSIQTSNQVNPIPVRKKVDWFFFDDSVNITPDSKNWPTPSYLNGVRVCAFKLDNMLDGTLCHPYGDPPFDFIWPRFSRIEELIILVGRFRKDVPPSRMKVIKNFQTNKLTPADVYSLHEDTPYTNQLTNSEKHMIREISRSWSWSLLKAYKYRQGWLVDKDGMQWLAYPVHDHKNKLSVWLASREGYDWLGYDWSEGDRPGSQFLASNSGWWWLASNFGFPWLETEQGQRWLETKQGRKFLKSPQALLWLNTGTYTPSSFTPLGTQVQKAWFSTPEGREWKFHNCPNGNPPAPPLPPQRNSHRPPNVAFPTSFENPHFQGWRFVIAPEELAERAASRRNHR